MRVRVNETERDRFAREVQHRRLRSDCGSDRFIRPYDGKPPIEHRERLCAWVTGVDRDYVCRLYNEIRGLTCSKRGLGGCQMRFAPNKNKTGCNHHNERNNETGWCIHLR